MRGSAKVRQSCSAQRRCAHSVAPPFGTKGRFDAKHAWHAPQCSLRGLDAEGTIGQTEHVSDAPSAATLARCWGRRGRVN